MEKTFILSLMFLLAITSCKKSNSTSNGKGTITANIDGTAVTFNTNAMAVSLNNSGIYSLAIVGFQGAANNSYEISISIGGPLPITANTTYTDDISTNPVDAVSFVYALFSNSTMSTEYAAMGISPNIGTVTITSISATAVQGTFSGEVTLLLGTATPTTHTITNGQFNLKF